MSGARSITARLSLVFALLFLQLVVLGFFSIVSLSYFDEVSSQVRDRWLPSTRVLGDLNNLTSDYRVAEASSLLAVDARERAQSARALDELDRNIASGERAYLEIPHDPAEQALYREFAPRWEQYRQVVQSVRLASMSGDLATARGLYNSASRTLYDAASRRFDLLNDRNGTEARQASLREDGAARRARRLIVLTIVFAGFSVVGALLYVRRSVSAPLLALAGRMHQLAANETGAGIEGTARQDEIGEMARAVVVFRNNALELVAGRRALEQQAAMLQEKLAEEQRLMQMQRNFVSMASHEFRTPLSIIDGHAQRLSSLGGRLSGEDLRERAGRIRSAVQRMTHLMQHLLDASRVIDGRVELYIHPEPIDLGALLREACRLQREVAPQAQILESWDRRPLPVSGDWNLLLQAFGNLLSNAVKYSPDEGLIKVSAACPGTVCSVVVEDRGIGIPAAERARVFERYFRGSNAAGITGTGVGLYFVRMVVELHGGQVAMESCEGAGSRFTVQLPLSAAAGNDAASRALVPAA
jgi:two-component system, OmpR family, sensor kinase